jgi:hypothetical protein
MLNRIALYFLPYRTLGFTGYLPAARFAWLPRHGITIRATRIEYNFRIVQRASNTRARVVIAALRRAYRQLKRRYQFWYSVDGKCDSIGTSPLLEMCFWELTSMLLF